MFFRNNTQAFMAAKFTEKEDFEYLHKLGKGTEGIERQRQLDITDFWDKRQADKTARKKARDVAAQATKERLAKLEVILDKGLILNTKG